MTDMPLEEIADILEPILEEVLKDKDFGLRIIRKSQVDAAVSPLLSKYETQLGKDKAKELVFRSTEKYLEFHAWSPASLEGIEEPCYVTHF